MPLHADQYFQLYSLTMVRKGDYRPLYIIHRATMEALKPERHDGQCNRREEMLIALLSELIRQITECSIV